jgi:hypothetical protein
MAIVDLGHQSWSMKFWDLSVVSEEEWTKGSSMPGKKED